VPIISTAFVRTDLERFFYKAMESLRENGLKLGCQTFWSYKLPSFSDFSCLAGESNL
jgi:hypothetical protein